jgi:two-component system, cell cycle sensor histidine kinase and response regulator CckA
VHKLLARQLKRAGLEGAELPAAVKGLLDLVDAAYAEADAERTLIERSLELMSRELTERNQALREELSARRRGEEDLFRIVENLPQAIFVRREAELLYVNKTAVRLLQYESASELVGRSPLDFVAPDDHGALSDTMEEARPGGQPTELRLLRKDGQEVLVERSTVERIEFGGAPAILVAFTNVTEMRELQSRMQIADRMASLGTMAAGVAHEINNPLAYVLANIDYAAETIEASRTAGQPPQEDCLSALADANNGARRVQRIVASLKTFSRVDDDARAPVAINDVLETAIQLSMNQIRHSARLVRRLEASPIVFANEGRLAQVFVNLLVNAAQAIPENRRQAATITVRTCVASKDRAVVEISDTGTGIPANVLPRIFEPFFTTKPHGLGTGLGLSICHGIVHSLGGTMEVESVVGEGTTFRVTLPRRSRKSIPPTSPKSDNAPPPRRARILVVDDEEAIGNAVRRVLVDHEVVPVADARAALRALREGKAFDVILCDIMMPDVTGVELFEAVRSKDPAQAARFVFLTGGTFTESTQEFLEKSERPKVFKPFSAADIRRAVSLVLAATAAAATPAPPVSR